jgi:hypothetical protein
MTHSRSIGSLVVHNRLERYGGNDRLFEMQFTSIIRFGRSALSHASVAKRGAISYCLSQGGMGTGKERLSE